MEDGAKILRALAAAAAAASEEFDGRLPLQVKRTHTVFFYFFVFFEEYFVLLPI